MAAIEYVIVVGYSKEYNKFNLNLEQIGHRNVRDMDKDV